MGQCSHFRAEGEHSFSAELSGKYVHFCHKLHIANGSVKDQIKYFLTMPLILCILTAEHKGQTWTPIGMKRKPGCCLPGDPSSFHEQLFYHRVCQSSEPYRVCPGSNGWQHTGYSGGNKNYKSTGWRFFQGLKNGIGSLSSETVSIIDYFHISVAFK